MYNYSMWMYIYIYVYMHDCTVLWITRHIFYVAGVHGYIDEENYIALIYNEKLSYLHNTVFSIVRAYWAYSSEHII